MVSSYLLFLLWKFVTIEFEVVGATLAVNSDWKTFRVSLRHWLLMDSAMCGFRWQSGTVFRDLSYEECSWYWWHRYWYVESMNFVRVEEDAWYPSMISWMCSLPCVAVEVEGTRDSSGVIQMYYRLVQPYHPNLTQYPKSTRQFGHKPWNLTHLYEPLLTH